MAKEPSFIPPISSTLIPNWEHNFELFARALESKKINAFWSYTFSQTLHNSEALSTILYPIMFDTRPAEGFGFLPSTSSLISYNGHWLLLVLQTLMLAMIMIMTNKTKSFFHIGVAFFSDSCQVLSKEPVLRLKLGAFLVRRANLDFAILTN